MVGFHLRGSADDPAQAIIVLYNPNRTPTTVQLPKGRWNICITDRTAGTAPLMSVEGGVSVAPISACVLTLAPVQPSVRKTKGDKLPLLLGAAAAVTAVLGGAAALIKKLGKK